MFGLKRKKDLKSKKYFYITTTLPYVNSDPHIGFAMEIIRADVIARYKQALGYNVFFNTGTDEHGLKIYQKAFDFGKSVQEYVDEYVKRFMGLKDTLGLYEDLNFIRTTNAHHKKSAQEFWKRCSDNGDIYKKKYKSKYCVGCELEKTDSEIENGKCFIHQNLELVIIEEENYFFRFSKYQKQLLGFYNKNPNFVVPDFRFNEIKKFVERGLKDFSISRLKEKMPWGVSVPGDDKHVMYVWFDALTNYISVIGWPEDEKKFSDFWTKGSPTQYAGKDNLRQQSAMWQAMLMSAGLPNSHQIVINGFVVSGGKKMSKSLGNVFSPYDLVGKFGTDALRYFVLREFNSFEDSDFTPEKFKEAYNANLSNGLGNLASRIMKMAETHLSTPISVLIGSFPKEFTKHLDNFDIQKAVDFIWGEISKLDESIQKTEPFKLVKMNEKRGQEEIKKLVIGLSKIANMVSLILPNTAEKILEAIKENKMFITSLFPRKD